MTAIIWSKYNCTFCEQAKMLLKQKGISFEERKIGDGWTKEELLEYEMPTYVEFISIGWMQTVIAWFVAQRVNRKIARWNKRQERKAFIKNYLTNTHHVTTKE